MLSVFAFDKPQNLTFDDRLQTFAERLTAHGEYPSDRTLLPIIGVCRLSEEVRRVLRGRRGDAETNEDVRLKMDLRHLETRLEDWKHSHKTNCSGIL